MTKYEIISFPSNKKSDFPNKELLEDSIEKIESSSPFYQLAKSSLNEIIRHENNNKDIKEDLLIRILSKLPSGTISLYDLNIVSSGLQRVFTSIYNNFFGKANNRGLIPKDIVDSSGLLLNATSPGSFKLHLNLNKNNPIMESHDEDALSQFSSLFLEIDKQEDYTKIAEEYGIRTFNILRNWFSDLDKNEIEFEYKNPIKNTNVMLTREKIKKTTQLLKSIKTREITEPIELIGELVSASSTNNSFEIKFNNRNIKGNTSPEIFKMGLTINKQYKFRLTKKIIENNLNGLKKDSYSLDQIEEIE